MAVKAGTTCFHRPSSSQTLASAFSSPTSKRQSRRFHAGPELSALFTRLQMPPSRGYTNSRTHTTKRACSASSDAFSDEEFSNKIQELALRFQRSNDYGEDLAMDSDSGFVPDFGYANESFQINSSVHFVQNHRRDLSNPELDSTGSRWPEIQQEKADWSWREEIIPASIERKANSVELPVSLRIIKRKMQREEGLGEGGESGYCSVKKAFSSMVFIIRELQSFALQMREALYLEDLQGILARVHTELHASFVWLFRQVFSQTPTLMVYVMILLANFTVHSMACNAVIAPPPPSYSESISAINTTEDHSHPNFESSSFLVSPSSDKAATVGGNNGGGGKVRPIGSGTDGEGRSCIGSEVGVWKSIVEEASKLQAMLRDEALDDDTVQRFISPVTAKIESDDYADYFKTEVVYQRGLSQDPHNSLLLANYAQFLYLVAQDHDGAEEYFKRAIKVEPPDAEALSKYATFLWRARNQTWAAEETYLEAINADPTNSYYAANYAHFLWNTGGEETCFPLQDDDV